MIPKTAKTLLFIDGSQFHRVSQHLRTNIDWKKVLGFFVRAYDLRRAHYYSIVWFEESDGEEDFAPMRKLLDWLAYNGYEVHERECEKIGPGNFETLVPEMGVDAIELSEHCDHIVFFTGDKMILPAMKYLQKRGKFVTVVWHNAEGLIHSAVRKQAHSFIDVKDILSIIARDKDGADLPAAITREN